MREELTALKVSQWHEEWDKLNPYYDKLKHRREPEKNFYLFKLNAYSLKKLTGAFRRDSKQIEREKDLGTERPHDPNRSREIKEFVKFGYPFDQLSEAKKKDPLYTSLRKPGWLPTAIVVNMLRPTAEDERKDKQIVSKDDALEIEDTKNSEIVKIRLPEGFSKDWEPKTIRPLEVIDGQHRLWAFEDFEADSFELPVVAFRGLDISWQAYLFWTINIKPKRVNASLAFDLYPLLRNEDWLDTDKLSGHQIYPETRAQELVSYLWSVPKSPWCGRIDMLGTGGKAKGVKQAGWIKSLIKTYINRKGVFGGDWDKQGFDWNRYQQAAFIMFLGQELKRKIENSNEKWIQDLKSGVTGWTKEYPFYGEGSFIGTDMGIRTFLYVTNDILYNALQKEKLDLTNLWKLSEEPANDASAAISNALRDLQKHVVLKNFVEELTALLSKYDWRTPTAPGMDPEEGKKRGRFRGEPGYKEFRIDILEKIKNWSRNPTIKDAATEVLDSIRPKE